MKSVAIASISLLALLSGTVAVPAPPPIDLNQLQALVAAYTGANINATLAALAPTLAALAPNPATKGLPPSAFIPADVLARLRSIGINPDVPSPDSSDEDSSDNAPSPDLTPAQLQQLLSAIFGSFSSGANPPSSSGSGSNSNSNSGSSYIPQGVIPQGVIPQGIPFFGRKMLAS